MTQRTIEPRKGFGRLFVLGGFTVVKRTRMVDITPNDVREAATPRQSASLRIVADGIATGSNSIDRSDRQRADDRAAIERGEDEGMSVAPKLNR